MSTDIEKLIREVDEAIAQAQAGSFESWCIAQGLDPEKVKATIASSSSPEADKRAREIFADDMAEINREVEARSAELGILREPATPQASAVRQRRRMGLV
jgi:hypothetical protein